MAIAQMACSDHELGVRAEDNEISVVAIGDLAFSPNTARQASWLLRHPMRHIDQREAAATSLRPHDRQSNRKTRDPAPSRSEVLFFEALHRKGTWRVVRHYQVDYALFEALPQRFPVFAGADRRSTLVQGRAVGDVFRTEMQIMRAGFDRNLETLRSRGAQFRQGSAGRKVNNVQSKAILATESQQQTNGRQLGFLWTGFEISGVAAPVGNSKPIGGVVNRARKLRVHQERKPSASNFG